MKEKKLVIRTSLIVVAVLIVIAAFIKIGQNKEKKVVGQKVEDKKTDSLKFTGKNTKYKTDNTTEVLVDKTFKKEDIVKSVKHGDHWHVWTKDGREHITYTSPDEMNSESDIQLVDVVSLDKLKGQKVKEIKAHGDHWHVFTEDGREFLTYEDPSKLFSNITIGKYTGNHGNKAHKSGETKNVSNSDVVKILKHGDHYHIYTKDGSEFISYVDPRSKYPNAEYGTYKGNHGDVITISSNISVPKKGNKISNSDYDAWKKEVNKLNIIKVLGQKEVDRFDIVKILKHGDHYHLYDSKGNEGLAYANPKALYPKATFGEYTGNHGGDNTGKKPEKEEVKWPKGVDRIVEHGDHYHIYIGDKEVGLVHEDPRSHYPNAVFEEDLTKKGSKVDVNDSELFTYDSIEAKLYKDVLPYLSSHIKNVTNYGELKTNLAIAGTDGAKKDIFYWNHGNHYHGITIKQLVQLEKIGTFGGHTAKEVASSLKYAIKNNTTLTKIDEKNTVNPTIRQIADFIKNHYNLKEEDLSIGENFIEIPLGGDYAYFEIIQFELKDGKVVPRIEMPTAESIAKEAEEFYDTEDEEDEEEPEKEVEETEENEEADY
ncbi:pneumococcal-type histidine triad protein [Helcococcus kunzii]|uniref:pneumococcal-type histidine triad protein n=1 Tax=Helcococcus kunzii TaxID=40091 RepID=UPI0024AD365E|nr:hypothetical protein [Helcococcus kunzii]